MKLLHSLIISHMAKLEVYGNIVLKKETLPLLIDLFLQRPGKPVKKKQEKYFFLLAHMVN